MRVDEGRLGRDLVTGLGAIFERGSRDLTLAQALAPMREGQGRKTEDLGEKKEVEDTREREPKQ